MALSPEPSCSIRVFDSLRRQQVPLPLLPDGERSTGRMLKLYVCGITPYDSGHMGHAFTFCVFDVLVRWVEASGFRVRYVQNVTDVDDPLFERARREGVSWDELAQRELSAFIADMDALGWRRPDVMPRVSAEIPVILSAVDQLVDRGFAYRTDAVYFAVERYPAYGELSHRTRLSMVRKLRDEGLLGEVGPGAKRQVLDFPLWRSSLPDEPAWPSPYGNGRPGWHIECTAMAMHHLGEQVGVHGGGRDLQFSHHESECAQSECLTGCVPFSCAWMHTGMVRYAGYKMSKSRGNLIVVRKALERAPAAAVRLYLISHRYRRDWTFSWDGLDRAVHLVRRLRELLGSTPAPGGATDGGAHDLVAEFSAALDDDLDTPRALHALRAAVTRGDAAAARWMAGILCGSAALW